MIITVIYQIIKLRVKTHTFSIDIKYIILIFDNKNNRLRNEGWPRTPKTNGDRHSCMPWSRKVAQRGFDSRVDCKQGLSDPGGEVR